ncbi:ROK family transcriptional regulator [Spirochaeta africana]|nr:ROK family transcriptional regulator [Spirochaeta africana]
MNPKRSASNNRPAKTYSIGVNDARVLRTLWAKKSMSRIELSRYLGLDKSTITKIVGNLLDSGIIELVAEGTSSPSGGRKPTFLAINPNFGSIIGIEMQPDFYIAVQVDFSGRILYQTKNELSLEGTTVAEAALHIYQSIQPHLDTTRAPLIGAAIGASGLINPYEGIIYQSNPLSISHPVQLYEDLDALFDIPVLLDNDANCGAWGELAFKKDAIAQDDFIYILGETRRNQVYDAQYKGIAIGTSMVLDQKVHYGQQYSAGEFQSIFRTGEYLNQFSVSDAEAESYEDDDRLFLQVAHELSQNIAFLVNMLNLRQVILGGRIEFHPEIISVMQEEITKNWSYETPVDVKVRFSSLQELTIAYGAVGMFLESFFSLPDISHAKKPVNTLRLRSRAMQATRFRVEGI